MTQHKNFKKIALMLPMLAMVALTMASCDMARNTLKADRAAGMETQDFRDGLAPRL